jgi:hypothetical protein
MPFFSNVNFEIPGCQSSLFIIGGGSERRYIPPIRDAVLASHKTSEKRHDFAKLMPSSYKESRFFKIEYRCVR